MAGILDSLANLNRTELDALQHRITHLRNSKTSLLKLPGEIRNRIWSLALIADLQTEREIHRLKQQDEENSIKTPNPCHLVKTSAKFRKALSAEGFTPHPPPFRNACRQMKLECESILYSDIMIWEELEEVIVVSSSSGGAGKSKGACRPSVRRKILKPYQVVGLFNVRELGVPVLKITPIRDLTIYFPLGDDRIWKDEHHLSIPLWAGGNMGTRRRGIVRFAKETGLPETPWKLQSVMRKGGMYKATSGSQWPLHFEPHMVNPSSCYVAQVWQREVVSSM